MRKQQVQIFAYQRLHRVTMENLARQIEEIGVLEAIYPEELSVDASKIELTRDLIEACNSDDSDTDENSSVDRLNQLPNLSLTMRLAQLTILDSAGKLRYTQPSITLDFPRTYPEDSPPIVTSTSGLDTEMMSIVREGLEEHSGEECTMQIIMSINDIIQARNDAANEEHEKLLQKQLEDNTSRSEKSDTKPILGRRIINSPYILKPAKIKDIKRCADELGLGGYAKVGKPGIIVIEGPEEACKQYCPMLEDRGWKYQKVQGQETQEGPAGGTIDELRTFHNGFRILPEDAPISAISKLCKDAGIGELFFSSLNIHDSSTENEKATTSSGKKCGKR